MKGITVPSWDVTKMPVIGLITTVGHPDLNIPETQEEVVAITENGTIYVLNKWYKPGVPQIRHKELVKEYCPK